MKLVKCWGVEPVKGVFWVLGLRSRVICGFWSYFGLLEPIIAFLNQL